MDGRREGGREGGTEGGTEGLLTPRNGCVLTLFPRAVCIHRKSPWKVTTHPLWGHTVKRAVRKEP